MLLTFSRSDYFAQHEQLPTFKKQSSIGHYGAGKGLFRCWANPDPGLQDPGCIFHFFNIEK